MKISFTLYTQVLAVVRLLQRNVYWLLTLLLEENVDNTWCLLHQIMFWKKFTMPVTIDGDYL